MLQIISRTTWSVLLLAAAVMPAGSDSRAVDWLLKDAYEEEYFPLSPVLVTLPSEVQNALVNYSQGNFRKAVEVLEKLRALNLPDGRLDFIAFALAESYRQLGCSDLARQNYVFIIKNFPTGEKAPPSLFRLVEFAVQNEDAEMADSTCQLFKTRYGKHPLMNSVDYLAGVLSYRRNDYEKAALVLSHIPAGSSRYGQAQFLLSLCHLWMKDYAKALLSLETVRKNAPSNTDLWSEAQSVIGDIYYLQGNGAAALSYYESVPRTAKRYQYAQVKTARIAMDLGKYPEAEDRARAFLDDSRNSQYFFEMASVLEQVYVKTGKEKDAAKIDMKIRQQIINARLSFEVFEEINKVADMMRTWQDMEYSAIRHGDGALIDQAKKNQERLQDLEERCYATLKKIAPSSGAEGRRIVPYQAERRYLGILKLRMALYDDTLGAARKKLAAIQGVIRKKPDDSTHVRARDSIAVFVDTLKRRRDAFSRECDLVLRECFGKDYASRQADEDLQAKFVDWAVMKYQDKKEELKRIGQQLSARKRAAAKGNEPENKKTPLEQEKLYTEADRDRMTLLIADERNRLASHLKTILEVYPKSKYNANILFRMAELYFDAAGDRFQEKLRAYEQKMAQGKDTAGLQFPEYQLDSVIAVYDAIIDGYPHSEIADGACYYKALALKKIGNDSLGNVVLLKLIGKYPESQYYVEANMNIGKYYFDHPKTEGGTGYKLAEEAYRRVLFFRDHPEYVSALYHLGWCYYMQDRYEEAIAVFKYLIEESHFDFDPSKMEEKQVANPLLRAEAIDYIAISFDAENKIDDAIQFLKLVGNLDYAAIVLKRIGELREEDLDFNTAIRVYQRLLSEYPESHETPATFVSLIRLYESRGRSDSAMVLREEFFNRFSRAGNWQKTMTKKDSVLGRSVDSMAILNGLYVADVTYRHADSTHGREEYQRAVKNYKRLVDEYPGDPRAAEALWNLAVILDTKLQDKPAAYDRYITFSRLTGLDPARREQAALNAVAIAQSLLPPDSAVQPGTVDFAASKVAEAVANYTSLFPSGASWSKVMLSIGAIYFNRHLFTNAAKIYEQITARGPKTEGYFEALSFLGQCHYGEENWPAAIVSLQKVWKESGNTAQAAAAYKLLLQSEFLNAKKFLAAGDYAAAARLYQSIDEKYPGSEYGDIVLFNAAESYEKIQQWDKACDRYYDLVKRYPVSKLAADALFNAAGDFEKANKFNRAIEAYEKIVADYAFSEKAKDALFNVGFCYEKLGQLDKMADANERYSARYPGEKDVETMLLRSASFYAKANMWDRAVGVYRNFIRRYPRNPKSIEAYFMIAKCAYDQGDKVNALLQFTQAEQQNMALANDKLETNNYFAAEASYYIGLIQREKFLAVKLAPPADQMKTSLKAKSDLLAEAAKAFQRVMQYRSERMFEAAYRVGQLYEDLSVAWKDQERPSNIDPIKLAVLEKEIQTQASGILQKSFIPFEKAISFAKEFDSLSRDQKGWVAKAESGLKNNIIDAGDLLQEAVSSMSSAPVPKEIREKPLHYFQYLRQLLDALTPLREQVREYWNGAVAIVDSLRLKGPEPDSCRSSYGKAVYGVGEGYDLLSVQIMKGSKELPRDMPQDAREDLVFQLEDIIYEVQDKAIFAYEDGLKRLAKRDMQGGFWASRIAASLARLSPDKYGSAFFKRLVIVSDGSWLARNDSASGWNAPEPPKDGWQRCDTVPSTGPMPRAFAAAPPQWIRSPDKVSRVYVWKDIFLAGAPRNAVIYIATSCPYRLFINRALIRTDTAGGRDPHKVDSATGIASMLQGGDNCVAIELGAVDPAHDATAIVFSALIDTTSHFSSSVKPPIALKRSTDTRPSIPPKSAPVPVAMAAPKTRATPPGAVKTGGAPGYVTQYRNRGELLMAIDAYNARAQKLNQQIKRERLEMQLTNLRIDSLSMKIGKAREESETLKEKIYSMTKALNSRPPEPPPSVMGDSSQAEKAVRRPSDTVPVAAPPAAGGARPRPSDTAVKKGPQVPAPLPPATVDSAGPGKKRPDSLKH